MTVSLVFLAHQGQTIYRAFQLARVALTNWLLNQNSEIGVLP